MTWNWNAAPGTPRAERRKAAARKILTSLLVGVLSVGVAWAGAGLIPVSLEESQRKSARPFQVSQQTESVAEEVQSTAQAPSGAQLPQGEFLVGADKLSLSPTPELFQPDGSARTEDSQQSAVWEKDSAKCNLGPDSLSGYQPRLDPDEPPHVHLFPDSALGWPHNPNCIYLGGYGLGPVRGATGVSDLGVWVRSIAVSNGSQTVLFQILDTVGYFNKYRPDICNGCGILDMRRKIAEEVGLPSKDFVSVGSTHTHGGADGYGGWGGVPKWYWHQMRDAVVASASRAIAAMTPARISVGAIDARDFGSERRDHYYSTHDYLGVWLQATTPGGTVLEYPSDPQCAVPGQAKKPECQPIEKEVPPSPIATLVNYAAHPTVLGSGNTLLHPDWPGAFARGFENLTSAPSDVALVFEGGLGNASDEGGLDGYEHNMSKLIADDIARAGTQLTSNDIAAKSVDNLAHPATNMPEIGLAAVGFFDREFTPGTDAAGGPMHYEWHKQTGGPEDDIPGRTRGCNSASPTSVITSVAGYRIGELNIFTGPGELFGNLTEVVKSEANKGIQTMVFGQTNDSLGYIMQSFEFDRTTSVATEYGTNTAEYEEVFGLDVCFGDHVLDEMLRTAADLGVRR